MTFVLLLFVWCIDCVFCPRVVVMLWLVGLVLVVGLFYLPVSGCYLIARVWWVLRLGSLCAYFAGFGVAICVVLLAVLCSLFVVGCLGFVFYGWVLVVLYCLCWLLGGVGL